MAIASTQRGRELAPRRRLVLGVGIALVTAHVLAFAQNLRRYTVGYDGPIQYWKNPRWSPPLSPLLLTVAYTILIAVFIGWTLLASHRERVPGDAYYEVNPARDREESAVAMTQLFGRA
jgi:hypothetical protein